MVACAFNQLDGFGYCGAIYLSVYSAQGRRPTLAGTAAVSGGVAAGVGGDGPGQGS